MVAGVWGVPGCETRGEYTILGTQIISRWQDYESTGEIVAVRDDSLLTETLTPVDKRGRLIELRPGPNTMIVHDRTDNTQVVLERCP